MPRIFDIVLGSVGLIVTIGLVAFGFFWMIKRSYDPGKMIFKCGFTIPFVGGCIFLAYKMGPFGPFLIVFMAVVLS